MVPVPNLVKWPDLPTIKIDANSAWNGTLPPVMPDPEKAIEANNAPLEAWLEELRRE